VLKLFFDIERHLGDSHCPRLKRAVAHDAAFPQRSWHLHIRPRLGAPKNKNKGNINGTRKRRHSKEQSSSLGN